MGSSSKQRKKTDKSAAPAAAAAAPSTSNKPSGSDDDKLSLEEHLIRAQSAVEQSQVSTLVLHQQWRTQLLRMSYLVMVVTLHIAQTPSSACIKDIKKWNLIHDAPQQSGNIISGKAAIVLLLHDSVVELTSIVCATFLVWCLSLPMKGNDFSTIPYRLSCAMIPAILSLHFQRKSSHHHDSSSNDMQETSALSSSCLSASSVVDATTALTLEDLRGDDATAGPLVITRHFPVILVFHMIVSISLWFMQYQNQQHQRNIEMVDKLKQDLLEAKKAKLDKKKR